MIFINTRPEMRSQVLTDAMQAKGLQVLLLPLLDLIPIEVSCRERQYQHVFTMTDTQVKPYAALVVVSPTAARLGLNECPQGFVPNIPIIAVGNKTAEVLQNAGWQISCPDEASNEGMMRMSTLEQLGEGDKLLIWRGKGGRRLLANHLEEKGVTVDAIAWYQRQCPSSASSNFEKLQQQLDNVSKNYLSTAKPIVLISSGEAFTNWRLLMMESKKYTLTDFQYLTFGHRLTNTLSELHLNCIRIHNLDPIEVWRGIQSLQ